MPYKNIDDRVSYAKIWHASNRDEQLTKMRSHGKVFGPAYRRSINGKFANLCSRAKRRGRECSLTIGEYQSLISEGICHYCHGGLPEAGCGLDRVDSSKGYTLETVRPCCKTCNCAKGDLTEDEFKAWLVRVYGAFVGKF